MAPKVRHISAAAIARRGTLQKQLNISSGSCIIAPETEGKADMMMRLWKLLLLVCGLLALLAPVACMETLIPVDEAHFPDAAFRDYIQENFDTDGNGLSEAEIRGAKEISVWWKEIDSLEGIEYFTALEKLYCEGNNLTALDVSHNTALVVLNCSYNKVTALDVTHNPALAQLEIQENQISTIDVSRNPALTNFNCGNNALTALDVSHNPALEDLDAYNNQLTKLDLSHNPTLTDLNVRDNGLTSLNVTSNTGLRTLNVSNNALTALNVTQNTELRWLYCNGNRLSKLDVTHNTLLYNLECDENSLSRLDVSGIANLKRLHCHSNQLAALDVSRNAKLETLECSDNEIATLDLNANGVLYNVRCSGNGLTSLTLDKNYRIQWLECHGNRLTSLDISNCPELVNAYVSGDVDDSQGYLWYNGSDGTLTVDDGVTVIRDNISGSKVALNETNFPDAAFRSYIGRYDRDNSGALSEAEIAVVDYMDLEDQGIASLKGIAFFTELNNLFCESNQLTALDVSGNTALEYLRCSDNQLTKLDVSKNVNLVYLNCSGNKLTALDVSHNPQLDELNCRNNQIRTLNLTNAWKMAYLRADGNQLTALNVKGCPALMALLRPENNHTDNGILAYYDEEEMTLEVDSGVKINGGAMPSFVDLPRNVRTIEDETFAGCGAEIIEINGEDYGSLTIGSRAFANCPNLICVKICDYRPNFADDAFAGSGLTIVTDEEDVEEWAEAHGIPCVCYWVGQ